MLFRKNIRRKIHKKKKTKLGMDSNETSPPWASAESFHYVVSDLRDKKRNAKNMA